MTSNIKCQVLLVLFIVGTAHVNVRAQAIISKIPADGTWARYRSVGVTHISKERSLHSQGTFELRCVGTVLIDMETYRWIETDTSFRFDDTHMTVIEKFLVRERDAEKGQLAADAVLKHYRKLESDGVTRIEEVDTRTNGSRYKILLYFAPKLDAKAEQLSKELKTIFGVSVCTGKSGRGHQKRADAGKLPIQYLAYSHPESPFGSVFFLQTAKKEEIEIDGPTYLWQLELTETGTGAESALPDKK